jgi:hypothetical protein
MTILDLPFRASRQPDARVAEVRPGDRATLGLMLALALCAAGAIHEVGWAEGTEFLRARAAAAVGVVLGLGLILVTVGRLWPPIAYVRADLAGLGAWLEAASRSQWEGLGLPAPETVGYVLRQVQAMSYRVSVWFWRAYWGQENSDRQVWLLLVSTGLYLATYFAGWQVFRHWRASLGLAVLGTALGTNSFLASQRPTWALALIGLGLVLLARARARGLEERWRSLGTDYSDELLPYATLIGLGVAALAVVTSPLVPALSSRATYEAFWRVFRGPWEQVEDTTGRLFGGLDSPPRRNPMLAGEGGLPDPSGEHSVGAGAPRGQRRVMWVKTTDPAPEPWAGGMSELDAGVLPQRHWRASTFDTYTGSGWINQHRETFTLAAGEALPDLRCRPAAAGGPGARGHRSHA